MEKLDPAQIAEAIKAAGPEKVAAALAEVHNALCDLLHDAPEPAPDKSTISPPSMASAANAVSNSMKGGDKHGDSARPW
jgi:hypothetical protein